MCRRRCAWQERNATRRLGEEPVASLSKQKSVILSAVERDKPNQTVGEIRDLLTWSLAKGGIDPCAFS
jgi:hypothetical protein